MQKTKQKPAQSTDLNLVEYLNRGCGTGDFVKTCKTHTPRYRQHKKAHKNDTKNRDRAVQKQKKIISDIVRD